VSPLTESPAEQKSHYRRNLLIVSGGLALLALAWWGFKVWIHSPQVPLASNLAVFALFNLNLIVFLLLVVLLFRHLVKLAFERRQYVLGARF
jgi:nitrogen fixation/metabolism regulation signal transduction histidine kinase